MKQFYDAPGPEDEPLLPAANAWVIGRTVSVPLDYWDLILGFAEGLDHEATARLRSQSGRAGWDHEDEIEISAQEAARTAAFLAVVAERIAVAEPLVPEPTETFPEAYYNEELARMVEAVQAVFAAAAQRHELLHAWTE
jgi:hypothetical protein